VANEEPLLDVAAALADGTTIDWESACQGATSDEDRRLLAELRFIAGMVRNAPPDLTAGSSRDSWGPLRIIEHIGRGTFGDVYRAWDTRLDREVALKILRRKQLDDPAHASTVIEEGRLLARVRHPNVVTVYGAERIRGEVGVWMEFVEGKTLEEELRSRGPFEVDRVIRIGVELSGALSTVHRAGLIHRDVKAQNVLRDRDGRLVLTDFGAGCELQDATETTRGLAGTPASIAPEMLSGQAATPQTDVYSLGVLLYHLVTGTYPVRGRSLRDIREAHANGARTPLAAARPDLPAEFVRIVDRALDPNPLNRYDSPDALGSELASLIPRSRARRTWKYVAAAVMLTVAAGFGAAAVWWTPATPTIAVLPFANLSAEAGSEYFVDGLTSEIIRNLSAIEGLEVRSLTSSFLFKKRPHNLREIGRQLRTKFVVEGSVRRSNGKLRVDAQLVRVADDATLWSNHFDRELKDVFDIQEEISRSVTNELRVTLGGGQRRYNTNPEAYELYLKASALVDPHSGAALPQAVKLFEQVIARDATFAPAYAGFANAWATLSIAQYGAAADEAYARMRPATEKALQLDPLLAEAHAAHGIVLARARAWADSEAAFARALSLNRNLSSTRIAFAMNALYPQGKVKEALQQLRDALSRDPLPTDVRRHVAMVLVSAGRYDEAIDECQRVLAVDPEDRHTRQVMARAMFHKGQTADAVAMFEKLADGSHHFRGYAYALTGRRAEAEAILAQPPYHPARVVVILAGLRDKDRTFEALERMAAEKDPRVGWYITYPELAFIREDPRMAAFRRTLGIPGS
jgi:TolB-like protein/tRNA A-37 threonylcarbamoyl transferase component Bud32/Flp pilus assembly protein TadD